MERRNNILGCHQGAIIEDATRVEHFVFLIDTSRSMRAGGVAHRFSEIHGELLDTLADEHPEGALVSLITFTELPHTQYVGQNIEEAPALDMQAKFGNDLPTAICVGLTSIATPHRMSVERITVVIITDGDTESHNSKHLLGVKYTQRKAMSAVRGMKAQGTRFLLLAANDDLAYAQSQALAIGIDADEVMLWEHSADSLSQTLQRAGEVLALGSASSALPSR